MKYEKDTRRLALIQSTALTSLDDSLLTIRNMVKYARLFFFFFLENLPKVLLDLVHGGGFLPSSCLFAGLTYIALRGKPGSPGMGKLVMPRVYISFSPWLLELHC